MFGVISKKRSILVELLLYWQLSQTKWILTNTQNKGLESKGGSSQKYILRSLSRNHYPRVPRVITCYPRFVKWRKRRLCCEISMQNSFKIKPYLLRGKWPHTYSNFYWINKISDVGNRKLHHPISTLVCFVSLLALFG